MKAAKEVAQGIAQYVDAVRLLQDIKKNEQSSQDGSLNFYKPL